MTHAQQNWLAAPLMELLSTLETGGRPKGGVRDIADGIPSLGGEHLSYGGKFKFEKLKFIPEEFATTLKSGKLSVDDVLVVKDGATTGKTVRVGKDFPFETAYVNEHVYLCRPSRNINSQFVTYFLRSDEGQKAILDNFRGAAQGGITKAFAENVFVPVAPLNEQIRIADKLDSLLTKVDAAQARLEKIPTLLKRFRQSVLSAATSGELTREWRDLKSIPLNYTQISFDNLLNELRNGLSPKPNEDRVGYPILRISSVRSGKVDQKDIRHLECSDKELERFKLRPGDLLFTRYNGSLEFVGVCGMIHDLYYENLLYPDKLIRARLNGQALPSYIEIYFSSPSARKAIIDCVKTTSGQKGISGADIKSQVVLLPLLEEQKEIVRRVESLFALADAVEKQYLEARKRIARLSQSLLAKAFRGELVPQDPNDEPAAELLKRIQAERQQLATEKPKRQSGARGSQNTIAPKQTKINTMQLRDAPENYLLELLAQLGGETHAEVLWKKSELAIDDFYAKLKQEMQANDIVEDKNSPDPALRKLKVANR